MRVGLRIHEAAATLVEVEQAHEEERRLARQDRPAIFHMEALPLGVPRREGVGQSRPRACTAWVKTISVGTWSG